MHQNGGEYLLGLNLGNDHQQERINLEALLEGYYNQGNVTNERIKQFEARLQQFKALSVEGWRFFRFCVFETRSDYLLWFCFGIFEELYLKHYRKLSRDDLDEIRGMLFSYQNELHYPRMGAMAKNKYYKTMVAMGKKEWSQGSPDYFSTLILMIQSRKYSLDGLIVVQFLCDDIVSAQSDLTSARKGELKDLLLQQHNIPIVLQMISIVLNHQQIPDRHIPLPFSTNEIELKFRAQYANTQAYPPSEPIYGSNNGTSDQHEVVRVSLRLCGQVYSWAPLDVSTFMPELFSRIIMYSQAFDESYVDLSSEAVAVLVEISAAKQHPAHLPEFSTSLLQNSYTVIDHLLKNKDTFIAYEEYLVKFIEYQKNLALVYLGKQSVLANLPPVTSYLDKLKGLTLSMHTSALFIQALEVWSETLSYLEDRQQDGDLLPNSVLYGFVESIQSVLGDLYASSLNKCLYSSNKQELSQIDCNKTSQDTVSEKEILILHTIDIISKVNVFYPQPCLGYFLPKLNSYCVNYSTLLSVTAKPLSTNATELDSGMLDYVYDLTLLTRVAGTFATVLCEPFNELYAAGREILINLLSLYELGNNCGAFTSNPTMMAPLLSEIIGSVTSFCPYVAFIGKLPSPNQGIDLKRDYQYFEGELVKLAITCMHPSYPASIVEQAIHLIKAITSVIKPNSILETPIFQQLQSNLGSVILNRPMLVQKELVGAIAECYIMPYPSLSTSSSQIDQRWDSRKQNGKTLFFDLFLVPYLNLPLTTNSDSMDDIISYHLELLATIVEITRDLPNTSKEIVYTWFDNSLETNIIQRIHPQSSSTTLSSLLALFLQVMSCLKHQISTTFIEHFFTQLTSFLYQQESAPSANSNQIKPKVSTVSLERLIDIIKVVARDPTPRYTKFVLQFLQVSQQKIKPMILNYNRFDLISEYFSLIFEILTTHWAIIINNANSEESMQYSLIVGAIFNDYIDGLSQDDLDLSRTILSQLMALNTTRRLFEKSFFVDNIAPKLTYFILELLAKNNLPSLFPEFTQCLYQLGLQNTGRIFSDLIPQLIYSLDFIEHKDKNRLTGFSQSIKQSSMDAPSFSKNIKQLFDDINYYYYISL